MVDIQYVKKNMSSKKFIAFGNIFPFSVVEIIIYNKNNDFLLTKRAITPYKNKWHFPGGVMYRNIPIKKMAKIIAKKEVNLDVKVERYIGTYEIKRPARHDISHVFMASVKKGTIKTDFQSTEAKFFKNPPKNMICFQKQILYDAKKILKSKNKCKKSDIKSL